MIVPLGTFLRRWECGLKIWTIRPSPPYISSRDLQMSLLLSLRVLLHIFTACFEQMFNQMLIALTLLHIYIFISFRFYFKHTTQSLNCLWNSLDLILIPLYDLHKQTSPSVETMLQEICIFGVKVLTGSSAKELQHCRKSQTLVVECHCGSKSKEPLFSVSNSGELCSK